LSAFETCPRRFKLTRITKEVREPQSEAMTHGNEVHKALENHINGAASLPDKYKGYQPIVDKIKAVPGNRLVEFKFALTSSFKPTTFFAPDAWVRGVIDFGLVTPTQAVVLDWKTGKPKDDADQLKLFAAAAFAQYPYVGTVKTGYVWLAHNKIDSQTFEKADVAEIWQEFLPRVVRLTKAAENDNFPPKPSGLCGKWCPVSHKQCEFSGRLS
jgi:hypothetical protein